MLPPKCFTCNKLLADIELYYENELKRIEMEPNHSDKDKEELKKKLVDNCGLTRYCCRMRLISYVDLITIIK
jgi:DNA-directed RNA polymerase subunit N (RpoN/RPB10)